MDLIKIAFYPCTYTNNSYIDIIQYILKKNYVIYDYLEIKEELNYGMDALYLNWIEDNLDEKDKQIICDYRKRGKKVIWVFHNRVSHNYNKREKCLKNLFFWQRMFRIL